MGGAVRRRRVHVLGWIPGLIHAICLINSTNAERRLRELVQVMSGKPKAKSFRLS